MMETKISIKTIYLLLVISIGLIGLGVGSTFAVFTASAEINDPITFSSNLTYDGDVFESFDVAVAPGVTRNVNFAIWNEEGIDNVNYAVWYIYEGDESDVTLGVDTSSSEVYATVPSGVFNSDSEGINVLTTITNNTSSTIKLTLGVATSRSNIILPSYMKIFPNNEVYNVYYYVNCTDTTTPFASQLKRKGADLTLITDKPTCNGKNFVNWNTKSDGSGTSYSSGGKYTGDNELSLYANYELNEHTLTINRGTGVSQICSKTGSATSYTCTTTNPVSLKLKYGTSYSYYGVASTGYKMNTCSSTSSCSGTITQDTTVTMSTSTKHVSINSYTLTITKGTGVSQICYKTGTTANYTCTTSSSVSKTLDYGTSYSYYGIASAGYSMNSCISSSPCSGTMGTSSINMALGNASLNKIKVYYNVNGGYLSTSNTSYSGVDSSGYILNSSGARYYTEYSYNTSIGSDGLPNYNNSDYINILKTDYRGISGSEWNTKADGSGTSYNQATNYNSNSLCNAASGDCSVTLYVNWEVYNVINDYRCIVNTSTYYYITNCTSTTCEYSKNGCSSATGTIDRNTLATSCSSSTINGYRCSLDQNNKYYITTCEGAVCKYTTKNGSSSPGEIIRCNLTTCNSSSGGGGTSTGECNCYYQNVTAPYVGGFSTSNICSSTTKVCNNTQRMYTDCNINSNGTVTYKKWYYSCS